MINYRFFIDGNEVPEVDNIQGWDKLVTSVKRDSSDLKGLLVSQDVKLVFIGDTYQFFLNKFYNVGICDETEILIQYEYDSTGWHILHEGVIKTPSLELDEIRGEATAAIQDNSFYAKINNNKNIPTVPDSGISKNGVAIDPAPKYDVGVFDCSDASSLGTAPMFWLTDVIKFMVAFMSDGEMGFESDFLNNDLLIMVCDGRALRTKVDPGGLVLNWSTTFLKIFDNLVKNRLVSFLIEDDGTGKKILRIEDADYFYQNDITNTFTNPATLKTSVDTRSLYSAITFGSDKTLKYPYLSFLEDIQFNGFKEESFNPLGQCNIDNELSLVRDFIVSSNVIQYILLQDGLTDPDTSYDNDICFIVAGNIDSVLLTADAKASNFDGAGAPVYYNLDLINSSVAESYKKVYQSSLASYIGAQTNDFLATVLNPVSYTDTSIPPIPFDATQDPHYDFPIINYQSKIDPGGNFNLGTDTYTVPITGFYTINCKMKYFVDGLYNAQNFMTVELRINGIPSAVSQVIHSSNNMGINFITISGSYYLTSGTSLSTQFGLGISGTFNQPIHQIFTLLAQTTFSATATPNSGGIYQEIDSQAVRNVFHDIEIPLKPQEHESILSSLRNKKEIQLDSLNYNGWIYSYSYDHKSQIAKIRLSSTINSSQ